MGWQKSLAITVTEYRIISLKKKKEKPQRGEHSKKYQKTSDLPRQGTKPHYIDETLAENNSLFFKK